MSTENGETEIKTPWGSVKGKKTAELIAVLSLVLLFLLSYVLWEHKAEAKTNETALVGALKEMAQAVREGNCINSYPEAERESKVETCKRITR